jgi:hypothetical protein
MMSLSCSHMCESRSTLQLKNWLKTISIEEKLDLISKFEKGEQIVDICHNVQLAHRSICTIHDSADTVLKNDMFKWC